MLRVCKDAILGYKPNINIIFPRDPTEKHHLYSRKRVIWKVVRPHPGFSVSVDRIMLLGDWRLDWRIIGLRQQQTAKQMASA